MVCLTILLIMLLCGIVLKLADEAYKSELHVLQSLLYTARMNINPWINGSIYMVKASKELELAEILNPNNPRIYYLKGKFALYTPKFMGGGKEAALP